VGTGVNTGSAVGDGTTGILSAGPTGIFPVVGGVTGSPDGGTGVGEGDFFDVGLGDAFDFFFADDAFAFFFFAEVGDFFGVGLFFFLGEAFGFGLGDFLGLGDLPGLGDVFATAFGFSSDETCADAGVAARTLAISSHKQKRATAHVTKRNLRRAEAPELNFPAPVRGAKSRSVFRPAIVTDRLDTSRLAE
jgi:hypothetical protein